MQQSETAARNCSKIILHDVTVRIVSFSDDMEPVKHNCCAQDYSRTGREQGAAPLPHVKRAQARKRPAHEIKIVS